MFMDEEKFRAMSKDELKRWIRERCEILSKRAYKRMLKMPEPDITVLLSEQNLDYAIQKIRESPNPDPVLLCLEGIHNVYVVGSREYAERAKEVDGFFYHTLDRLLAQKQMLQDPSVN